MDIQAVSLERHNTKRWKRFGDFNFAKEETVVPIAAAEITTALCNIPIGFIEENGAFTLVAIQGLVPNQNLLVTAEGKWGSPFLPDCYRCYPFRTAKNAGSDEATKIIVVDEASDLVVDADEDVDEDEKSEHFFDEAGNPSEIIQRIIEFLTAYDAKIEVTQSLCAALAKENLIQPWKIQWQEDSEGNELNGLFCIDEAALNDLPAEKYAALREDGATVLAYGQLFSMQHITKLIRIVELGSQQSKQEQMQAEVFANALDSGSLSFDNL